MPDHTPKPSTPPTPRYFDYVTIAHHVGFTAGQLQVLEQAAAADYPGDQMMIELRLLRTCNAVKNGAITGAEAVRLAQADLLARKDEAA